MSEQDPEATAVHSGARSDDATAEVIAIPGYRIERRLGEGGMGAVYLAEEIALSRRVAIKVVSDRIARDPDVRARFLREARLLATVEHPNVVRIYTFGSVGDRPYLVMEYIEGETLAERIQRSGAMDIDDALGVLRDVADALSVAWEKQVIHRDIKPSNILFDRRGRLKVADFGLAKGVSSTSTESSLTQTGYLLGSPHYIAPEQAQGHESEFRADIYSLGIVLFEMVTGRRPFEAASAMAVVAKHLHDELPSARAMRRDLPEHIDDVIRWMTEKDPKNRPQSYAELLASIPAAATTQEFTPPRISRRKRGRSFLVAAMLAGLAILLGVLLARQRLAGGASAEKASDGRTVIAVAPFYGPDPASAQEGRVMASMVESEIGRRMHGQVKVLGVEETRTALRDTDAARALGERLGASLVIWGDAIKFNNVAEIEPSLTVVPRKNALKVQSVTGDPFADFARPAVRVATEAPNQIELRKTSAKGIGELVVLAVATQLLHEEDDAEGALALLAELPLSADVHHQKAVCLMRLRREGAAVSELQKAIALDPKHGGARALLASLAMREGHYREAAAHLAAVGSESFSSADGMLYDGKLYAVEQYRNFNRLLRTPTLLAIDPDTERVLERYWLPGPPVAFSVDGDDLVIRYDGGLDGAPQIETVRFAHGHFEPPRQLPANPFARMNAMRAAWIIPQDFMTDVATPNSLLIRQPKFRYNPSSDSPRTGPKTLVELRTALEKAIERDPTQPGYPLWLAMTLWELEDHPAAERFARQALGDGYPEIPYYHYSWAARQLEAFDRREWADLAYAQALRRRKMRPDPISSTLLIERLIAAPATRGVAARSRWAPDPPRHFEWVRRTRELSGVETIVDPATDATWARYFEMKGDAASAAKARSLERQVTGENPARWAVMADLLFAAIFASLLVTLAVIVMTSVRALRAVSWRPISAASRISRGSRVAIVSLLALLIVLGLVQIRVVRKIAAITSVPFGLSDTLGSPPIIRELEKSLPEHPELTFAAAVANHLAGRVKRASELYAQATDGGVSENTSDLRENRPPRYVPASADVRAMLTSVRMTRTLDDVLSAWTTRRVAFAEDEWGHRELHFSAILGVVFIVLLAFCAWIAIAPPDDSSHPLRTLRLAIGAVAVLFLLGAMLSYRMGTKDAEGAPCPGPITARFQPAYGSVAPMPPMPTYEAAVLWTTAHSAQFRIFNGLVIAAAALALVLLGPLLLRYTIALARRPASPIRN